MTKEDAKKLLPIMQAFAEGKTIEILIDGRWETKEALTFTLDTERYRIKPEPIEFWINEVNVKEFFECNGHMRKPPENCLAKVVHFKQVMD